MLLIQARFLSGRFHANPWGHHVNEGLVEWPPSPWRLLRALLSAGFTRLGWEAVPENGAALIELLASRPPRYHLPPATTSHTRHYMPLYGGKTTRIIDAFASVSEPLVFEFDVDPEPDALTLLDRLLASVPYLGRAESTVELTRVDRIPAGHGACEQGEAAPSVEHEGIALLAPEDAVAFVTWRESAMREALASLSASASAKGKAPTKKDVAKADASLPKNIVHALLATTPDLQREGWSRPPGTRWLSYWRPHGALEARPRAASPATRRRERTDTALFALASDTVRADVLPAMRDALYRMEALHQALVLKSAQDRPDGPSPCFTGSVNGDRIPGHRHATLIPLTLGRRHGRIDHVLVHAPMGFDSNPAGGALGALGAIRKIWAKDLPDVFVVLAGTGVLRDFEKAVPLVRRASMFRSWTPFVPPRHPKEKGKDTLLGQVQAELATRGMPAASRVELQVGPTQWEPLDDLQSSSRAWPRFRGYARRRSSRPPPVDVGLSLRLMFDREASGPITLGYGSHFGLGAFEPCDLAEDCSPARSP